MGNGLKIAVVLVGTVQAIAGSMQLHKQLVLARIHLSIHER